MADPRADRVTLGYEAPLELPERKETPERTVHLVLPARQVLQDWPVSAVSSVCPDNVVREASPACLDLLVSPVSREVLVAVETEDPPDL